MIGDKITDHGLRFRQNRRENITKTPNGQGNG